MLRTAPTGSRNQLSHEPSLLPSGVKEKRNPRQLIGKDNDKNHVITKRFTWFTRFTLRRNTAMHAKLLASGLFFPSSNVRYKHPELVIPSTLQSSHVVLLRLYILPGIPVYILPIRGFLAVFDVVFQIWIAPVIGRTCPFESKTRAF